MKTDWKAPILAGLGLVSLAVAIPMGVASAQQNDQATVQRGGQAGNDQFQRGQFRGDMPPETMQRGMMGGGGAIATESDNNFLYIVQGNMIWKVNKQTLETVGQSMLPMPGPRGPFEGAVDRPGAPGVRSGGAGGATRATGGETGTAK